jgi:hypothetical protein
MWKDLYNARLDQNVISQFCGSNLDFAHSNGNVGAINNDGNPIEAALQTL